MSSRPPPAGVTLIEVVAGAALLGTLLASILVAQARVKRQACQADRRLEACAVAEELLQKWWARPESLPRSDSGSVDGRDGWSWRTRPVERTDAQAMGAQVVALEVFWRAGQDQAAEPFLARVELLLPARSER